MALVTNFCLYLVGYTLYKASYIKERSITYRSIDYTPLLDMVKYVKSFEELSVSPDSHTARNGEPLNTAGALVSPALLSLLCYLGGICLRYLMIESA